ncbi:outer membrane beta-barrel family protein [Flavobacterium sp. H122]|uniref:outer membrane beta-barrel family protein n=1 Tax=Flavobacterium sp. H122 TaxID=2529860 RepID=UPI0010A9CA33|nr:outer membrane beta-barrel family protein [Flavobacterium sp. H122]
MQYNLSQILKATLFILMSHFYGFSQIQPTDTLRNKIKVPEKEENFNIGFNSQYKQNRFSGYVNSLNLVYNYKKWSLNTGVGYNDNKGYSESDVNTYFTAKNYLGKGESKNKNSGFTSYFNVQYLITDKSRINLFYKGDITDNSFRADNGIYIDDINTQADSEYKGFRVLNSDIDRHAVNALFRHDFNKPNEYFTLEADWLKKRIDFHQNTYGFEYDMADQPISGTEFGVRHGGVTDLDVYTLSTSLNSSFNGIEYTMGANWTYINFDCDIDFYQKNNSQYEYVQSLSPLSSYKENRQTVFFDLKKKINKWDFKGGIKLENTITSGFLLDSGFRKIKNEYLSFLPSLGITYNVNATDKFLFTYMRTINRPQFRFLNPTLGIYHAYENYLGNPFLNPSFTTDVSLKYAFKSKYSLDFQYLKTNDYIWALTSYTSDNVVSHIIKNYLDLNTYQLSANTKFKWVDISESRITLRGFYKFNNPQVNTIKDVETTGWFIMLNNDFYLNKLKTLSGNLNFWYMSKDLQQEAIVDHQASLDLWLNYSILKDNLKFSFAINDVLGTMQETKRTTIEGINQYYRNYWEQPRNFKVSLLYKFGNKKLVYTERNSSNTADYRR